MHNTHQQNEAFKIAFDATNARWRAAVVYDKKVELIKAHLETIGVSTFTATPANGCIMVTYGRVVAYYLTDGNTITDIIYD